MIIEDYWKKAESAVKNNNNLKIIYIIGNTDTGKTTFASFLLTSLNRQFRVGFLDCDPGQTTIGPPCTIGLGIYEKAKKKIDLNQPDTAYFRFIGSTTPSGHLLQTVTGVKRLAEKADSLKLDKLIVDSSGFVLGNIAGEFQFQLMDQLGPHYIIEIYDTFSLKPLLLNFTRTAEIIRMKASGSVKEKTALARRQYREARLKEYFSSAIEISIKYDRIGFHGRIPHFTHNKQDINLLLALCNRNHFVITLGILMQINVQRKIITLISPPFQQTKIASIHFSDFECNTLC